MSVDPRIALALKYQHTGLQVEAWATIADLVLSPDAEDNLLELGLTLRQAASAYSDIVGIAKRLLKRQPQRGDVWALLAEAHDRLGQPTDAIAAYERAHTLSPSTSIVANNFAAQLMGQGRFAEAARILDSVLTSDQNNASALVNRGVCDVERGAVEGGRRFLQRALKIDAQLQGARDNAVFALHNIESDPLELLREHQLHSLATQAMPQTRRVAAGRKIRIGYVSPDFRQHSVSYFAEALFRHHSRSAFEVYAYANSLFSDAVTKRFQELANGWRNIWGRATNEVAALIRADQIDVLIDLAGHTQGHRLDVFAARPAPIQLTAIGYPGTTGAEFFDGRIADILTDPLSHEAFSSEPLVRIVGGMHAYMPPACSPDVSPLPRKQNGYVTFGSFNKLAKISESTLSLWAQVLKAVPRSRMLMKSKPFVERETQIEFAQRCVRAGIDPSRIDLRSWDPDDQGHLRVYHGIDIALDTYPYNGTTTTCEALWMGVPVISLYGQTHASRVGLSLLTSAGMEEFACATPDDMTTCAQRWASPDSQLGELRQSLRERVARSRLCDGKAYALAFESAVQGLLRSVLT